MCEREKGEEQKDGGGTKDGVSACDKYSEDQMLWVLSQLGHTVYTTVCSIYFQDRLLSRDVVLVPGSASNAIFHLSVSRVCVFIREFAHVCIYVGGESRPLHVRAAVLVSRRPAPVKPSSDCRPHPLGQGCVGWWRWWWWRRERGKQHLHHVTSLYDRLAPLPCCLPSKTKVSSVLSSNQSNTNQTFRDRMSAGGVVANQ